MAERGYAHVEHDVAGELNWELRWPQSIRVFARMVREDTQIKSLLSAVKLPIRRTTWRINPNGARDEVVRLVAEDLRLPILGDDGTTPLGQTGGHASFQAHLPWALRQLDYGHAFFEVIYREHDGRDRLHKLAYRPPSTISKIHVERDGGLAGIEQHAGPGDKGPVRIPVEHLVAYIHDPEDMSWRGTSVLRAAYKNWVLRDRQLRLEDRVLDRNGMGVPLYTAATNDPVEVKRGEEIARKLRSGASSGGSVPFGAKLDLKGVSGQLVSPRESIVYHDSQMARSVLAHFLNLEGKGGSYALAEVQAHTFVQSLQTIAEDIQDTFNRFVIEPLVNTAFDTDAGPYPVLTFDPIGSVNDLPLATLAVLVNAGVILPDRDLEEEVRRRGNLPPKRPYDGTPPDSGAPPASNSLGKAVELIRMGLTPEDAFNFVGLDPAQPVIGAVHD